MHIDGEQIGQACAQYISLRLSANNSSSADLARQIVLQPRLLWRGDLQNL
jgi:hypothetical protein